MGNTIGTKLTTIKDEISKKVDETRARFDESIKYKESSAEIETSNNVEDKKIPKISITGTKSDLLDESVIDKSLRGDIEITKDDFEDTIQEETINDMYQENEDSEISKEILDSPKSDIKKTNSIIDTSKLQGILTNIAKTNKEVFASLKGDNKTKQEIQFMDDCCITVNQESVDIAKYCVPLLQLYFCGQTTSACSDKADTKDVLNLGLYLKLVDKFLRQFETVTEFTGEEEEYHRLLKLVSLKRKKKLETTKQCFNRILSHSKRFVKIYHARGVHSERLQHKEYWGSKQQMLSAKVIADWVDPDGGPIDPIFGAILQPTTGRCGPGDSGLLHNMLFDDTGYMAFHSAVHDAFGYLINFHEIGPGYDYIGNSRLDKLNPLSGQLSGVKFWKEVIQDIETQQRVIAYLEI